MRVLLRKTIIHKGNVCKSGTILENVGEDLCQKLIRRACAVEAPIDLSEKSIALINGEITNTVKPKSNRRKSK